MVSEGIVSGELTLASSDFDLFGLAATFDVDPDELDRRWKQLQRQVHPDHYSTQTTADKRLAMQWSLRVNEAYQRLKHPVRRAAYLCELNGVPIRAEGNTSMPADFLIQQMQWREELEAAHELADIEVLRQQVKNEMQILLQQCAQSIEQETQWVQAAESVRALMFIERFLQDVDNRLERIENN
jgi:molecular chaperone HscB